MVHTECLMLHAYLYATADRQFIGVNLGSKPVFRTGRKDAVEKAAAILAQKGALKCVPLNVSGPFHSKLLEGAGEKLGEVLADVALNDVAIPYVANTTAEYVTDKADIKDLLVRQVSSSVRFTQTIELLMKDISSIQNIG